MTTLSNSLSCTIMVLVVLYARKLTQQTKTILNESPQQKTRLNIFVTFFHITIITVYTIVSILRNNVAKFDGKYGETLPVYRNGTTWIVWSGLLDLFLSTMIFFILDDAEVPENLREINAAIDYDTFEVIKSDSVINTDFE